MSVRCQVHGGHWRAQLAQIPLLAPTDGWHLLLMQLSVSCCLWIRPLWNNETSYEFVTCGISNTDTTQRFGDLYELN